MVLVISSWTAKMSVRSRSKRSAHTWRSLAPSINCAVMRTLPADLRTLPLTRYSTPSWRAVCCRFCLGFHEAAVANDIGRHDRRQPPRALFFSQAGSPSCGGRNKQALTFPRTQCIHWTSRYFLCDFKRLAEAREVAGAIECPSPSFWVAIRCNLKRFLERRIASSVLTTGHSSRAERNLTGAIRS
jgi:hypothetical protein